MVPHKIPSSVKKNRDGSNSLLEKLEMIAAGSVSLSVMLERTEKSLSLKTPSFFNRKPKQIIPIKSPACIKTSDIICLSINI